MRGRGNRNEKLALGIVALVASSAVCGCAIPRSVVEQIPRQTTPIVIDEGLRTLDEPAIKRRIERMMASPEMRAIEQELVAGLIDGTVSSLDDEARASRIHALTSRSMEGLLRMVSAEIAPMTAQMSQAAVRGAMTEALSPARRRALESSVASLMEVSVRSAAKGLDEAELGKSIALAMSQQIGPALEKVLRENIGPGLGGALKDEELQRALGATVRVIGREMVLGVTEGLAEADRARSPESPSLLSRATELARQGARFAGSAAWLLGVLVLLLVAWVVRLLAQARRYREEAGRREAMARLLAEATRASEGKPWSDELLSALEERFRSEEEALATLRRARRKRTRTPPGQPPTDGTGQRPSLA